MLIALSASNNEERRFFIASASSEMEAIELIRATLVGEYEVVVENLDEIVRSQYESLTELTPV